MLVEVLEKIKEEVLSKQASATNIPTPPPVQRTEQQQALQKKASPEKVQELMDKLTRLGLAKYAAYVEEIHEPDVAAELAILLAEELEKRASAINTAFRPTDAVPSASSVDPITAFALGLS